MTQSDFLSIFEKHLLVGEPKRGEILAELKTHLNESKNSDPLILGKPKQLAKKYNLTHIGTFGSEARLFSIPIIGVATQTLFKWVSSIAPVDRLLNHGTDDTFGGMFFAVYFIIPLVVAALFGRTLARIYQPARLFLFGLIIVVVAGTIAGTYYMILSPPDWENPDTLAGIFVQSCLFSIVYLFYCAPVAVGSTILSSPQLTTTRKAARTQLQLKLLLSLTGLGFIVFWTINWLLMGGLAKLSLSILGPAMICTIFLGRFIYQHYRKLNSIQN